MISEKRKEILRVIKFVLFSMPAGIWVGMSILS